MKIHFQRAKGHFLILYIINFFYIGMVIKHRFRMGNFHSIICLFEIEEMDLIIVLSRQKCFNEIFFKFVMSNENFILIKNNVVWIFIVNLDTNCLKSCVIHVVIFSNLTLKRVALLFCAKEVYQLGKLHYTSDNNNLSNNSLKY